jgi:hypothetical protein
LIRNLYSASKNSDRYSRDIQPPVGISGPLLDHKLKPGTVHYREAWLTQRKFGLERSGLQRRLCGSQRSSLKKQRSLAYREVYLERSLVYREVWLRESVEVRLLDCREVWREV